jgi:hypothetical protein
MHYKGKLKLKSHNTSYCLIEVATKAGLTVSGFFYLLVHVFCIVKYLTKQKFSISVDWLMLYNIYYKQKARQFFHVKHEV